MNKKGLIGTLIIIIILVLIIFASFAYFRLTSDKGLDLSPGDFEINIKYNDTQITGGTIAEINNSPNDTINSSENDTIINETIQENNSTE